ncbi:hypothetical protein AVEN_158799-1 [Araneus ventricosus]|uniref:Reverse transcriptase RNase H-like domain-containing protein n=1 Tax=Araneus ventricosus TaxID=182803 RepID=A0A4Y2NKU1_ARAVE|nr:hypothetical protein AVEN_158799-1 [Araneus ventricosus]
MGVVLSHRDAENENHPILYLSKKISDAERKYSATERECAAIIYAIKELKYYLDGQNLTIETDHKPLVWLKSNAGSNPRLMYSNYNPFDIRGYTRQEKPFEC